jgi:hypothetical protein
VHHLQSSLTCCSCCHTRRYCACHLQPVAVLLRICWCLTTCALQCCRVHDGQMRDFAATRNSILAGKPSDNKPQMFAVSQGLEHPTARLPLHSAGTQCGACWIQPLCKKKRFVFRYLRCLHVYSGCNVLRAASSLHGIAHVALARHQWVVPVHLAESFSIWCTHRGFAPPDADLC